MLTGTNHLMLLTKLSDPDQKIFWVPESGCGSTSVYPVLRIRIFIIRIRIKPFL